MDRWDWMIVLVAAYLAIVTLVRLMAGRRNHMIQIIRDQFANHTKRGKKKPKEPNNDSNRDAA